MLKDGAIGRNGLAILRVLLFDFLNYRTGQLDPACATIARKAGISLRSVRRGLDKLRETGMLFWQRRCRKSQDSDGRFMLEQESNAYGVRPVSHWPGLPGTPRRAATGAGNLGGPSVRDAGRAHGGACGGAGRVVAGEGAAA